MAERKAVNKYYPPDWDPRKGSVNKRVGQHPLRDRARKLSQGILVIRFELPYNIWCGGCGNHIGMGVRYNAEKSKVGNYYTTPIYKFRMKCHLCDNYFEIQTDPKNHDYVILSGARRKEQRWDPVANEQVVPEDKATQKKLATDPMYKLEHGSDDQQKGKEKVMSLTEIEESRMSMQDDYILNRMARDKFRAEKKQLKEAADADRAILEKASLNIDLVEETEEDRKLAGLMKYSVTASFEDRQRERRKNIEQRPLFSVTVENSLSPKSSSSSASPYTSPNQQHVPAALGQHGDLKHKLLHTSYKDPFRCVRKPNRKASSSSILPGHSRLGIKLKEHSSKLGIKLKSSRDVTFVTPKVVQERKMDKADDFMKSQPTVAIPEATDAHSGNQDIGDTPRAIISDASSSDVALVHEEKDHTESTDFAFQPSGTTDTPENVLASPELSSSLSSASESESGSKQLKASLIATDSREEEDCPDDKVKQTDSHERGSTRKSRVDKKTSGEVGFNNTGLQTLMCSYTDSDSELSS